LGVLLVGLMASSVARAGDDGRGFEAGLRTGVAFPSGKLDNQSQSISNSVSLQVPFWFDVGYRIIPEIYVGGYFQYGFGITHNCPDGASCSANDIRLGANIHYHPRAGYAVDPWLGFGVGYEFFNLSSSGGGQSADGHANGFEFANFQAGIDFHASPSFRVGPFLSFSVDETTSESATLNGVSASASDFDKATHSRAA